MDNSDSRLNFLKQRLEEIEKELLDLNYKRDSLKLELDALPPATFQYYNFTRPRVFETKKTYNKRDKARKEVHFKAQYKVQKKIGTLDSKISNLIIQQINIKKELEEISK